MGSLQDLRSCVLPLHHARSGINRSYPQHYSGNKSTAQMGVGFPANALRTARFAKSRRSKYRVVSNITGRIPVGRSNA
jgi:hypothetical protein